MNVKAIILAGGNGKRLWPISRLNFPKQCIPFKGDKTLLELTLDRISKLKNLKDTYVVTTNKQQKNIEKIIASKDISIIVEPDSRNTAPALLLSILKLYSQDPQAVLLFLPSDHHICPDDLFLDTLDIAVNHANNTKNLVLLGIKPIWASTAYGYIKYKTNVDDQVYKVNKFLEKPDKKKATRYFSKENYLWNSGIFCAKASVFLKQFMDHSPELLEKMLLYQKNLISYSEIPQTSFDKVILEKTDDCVVVPASFTWTDVGSLEHFINVSELVEQNNKIICYNANNNIVKNLNKTVILSNVNDLCIVQMNDLIFICPRSQADDSNSLRDYLKNNGYENYL